MPSVGGVKRSKMRAKSPGNLFHLALRKPQNHSQKRALESAIFEGKKCFMGLHAHLDGLKRGIFPEIV
jgi:hypothetical protein